MLRWATNLLHSIMGSVDDGNYNYNEEIGKGVDFQSVDYLDYEDTRKKVS